MSAHVMKRYLGAHVALAAYTVHGTLHMLDQIVVIPVTLLNGLMVLYDFSRPASGWSHHPRVSTCMRAWA